MDSDDLPVINLVVAGVFSQLAHSRLEQPPCRYTAARTAESGEMFFNNPCLRKAIVNLFSYITEAVSI